MRIHRQCSIIYAKCRFVVKVKKELRVDDRYLLWINKKSFLSSFSIYLFQTENIEFCCFSHSSDGSTGGKIGLKYSNGNEERLITLEGDFGGLNMSRCSFCVGCISYGIGTER